MKAIPTHKNTRRIICITILLIAQMSTFFNLDCFGQLTYADSVAIRHEAMRQRIEAAKNFPPGNFGILPDSRMQSVNMRNSGPASTLPFVYHWFVATNGNDSGPGTQSAPFRTIQRAINAASNGQAIKVANGYYEGTIDFMGKSIKLVGNPDDPVNVSLGVKWLGHGIKMTRGENSSTLVCGFVISRAANPSGYGGGIYLDNGASPLLANLIIFENWSLSGGSALAAFNGSSPVVQNTEIYRNESGSGKYMIYLENSNAIFRNVTIDHNDIARSTFGVIGNSRLTVMSSIINNPQHTYYVDVTHSEGSADISFSNIRGGLSKLWNYSWNNISTNGIIDVNPVFDLYSYLLGNNSPCIDAGHPAGIWSDLHIPPSKGTTRNDMGAYGGPMMRYSTVVGDNLENPILVSVSGNSFNFHNSKNTNNFSNAFGRSTNEVCYRFTLPVKMNITASHCGSGVAATHLYLLDAVGNVIAENDYYSGLDRCENTGHAYLHKSELAPGTYYVVSEGISQNGEIATRIRGTATVASAEFGYSNAPDTISSMTEAVGSVGGVFDVSSLGAATYTIPIEVPLGVNGLQPTLALVYNSQTGNGIAGWGCNIAGLSAITRGPKNIYHDSIAKGMTFLADEAYYLDGQRLIYSSGTPGQNGAVYFPESDPFTKITVYGTYNTTTANTWFEVTASNGMKYRYGSTSSGRQSYSTASNSSRILSWYLDYVEDPLGNTMSYTYNKWNNFMYPGTITYGSNKNVTGSTHTVSFEYESRTDVTPFIIDGVSGSMAHRLKTITSRTGSNVFRSYTMQYNTTSDGSATKFSRLTSVIEKNGANEALKPTVLSWSYLPSTSMTGSTPVGFPSSAPTNNMYYISVDLNGDGIDDLVEIDTKTSSTHSDANIYESQYVNGQINFTKKTIIIPLQSMAPDFLFGTTYKEHIFNKQGRKYVLLPMWAVDGAIRRFSFTLFDHLGPNNNNVLQSLNMPNGCEKPAYTTGSLRNNGTDDFVYIQKEKATSGQYQGKIGFTTNNASGYNPAFTWSDLSLELPASPEKLFIADFNGNGINDLLVFYNNGYTVFWNTGNATQPFSNNNKTLGTNISNVHMIQMGDFNGDGLPDFIMNAYENRTWHFALNKGNGTFDKPIAYTFTEAIHDQETNKDHGQFSCHVFDFDMDGKSDVVITKGVYYMHYTYFLGIPVNWEWRHDKTYTFWMRSDGSKLVEIKSVTSTRDSDAESRFFVTGDFTGSGQIQLANYGYNCYSGLLTQAWRIYSNPNFNVNSGKITSITNGMGQTTSIQYASFTNGGIYTRGTGTLYPMADIALPLHAVKTVTSNNGAAGNMTTNYKYRGLKAHLQGKGLLGLSSTTITNTTLGTEIESGVKDWHAFWLRPWETYTKVKIGNNSTETAIDYKFIDKGSKKLFIHPEEKREKDLDGNTVTSTYTYDTNGNLTRDSVSYATNMYRVTNYSNYISTGNGYKPQAVTVTQRHPNDAAVFTQKTSLSYNANGLLSKKIENDGVTGMRLTTEYLTYDAFGNLKSSRISGDTISAINYFTDYDATGRFPVKHHTSPASTVLTFEYDTWGNIKKEKDETNSADILVTSYDYDNWGRLKLITLPDNRKAGYSTGWGNTNAKCYYTLAQGTGTPWVKTWYDAAGREVLSETRGAGDMIIATERRYNSKGELAQLESMTGNFSTVDTFTYDTRGRVLTYKSSQGSNVSYSYGNRTITTTDNGRVSIRKHDAWGGITESTDAANGKVLYEYFSTGQPKKMTAAGAVYEMKYDAAGNQTELKDPNAGTTTWTYDALGRVKTQRDGRGNVITRRYDRLGRDSIVMQGGVSTLYTYGTSGNSIHRLTKVATAGNSTEYTYDRYGRPLTEKRTITGESALTFTYTYNMAGKLETITYPGNAVKATNHYDAYGNRIKTLAGTQTVWELTGNTGMRTTARLGGSMTSVTTRNTQGLLTGQSTTLNNAVIRNLNYEFSGSTGNLTSRTGMISQKETFGYDPLDRLTTVHHGTSSVMTMGYDAAGRGNIVSKTGLGAFTYHPQRVHAVETIENTSGLLNTNKQTVDYTAFNKASKLTDTQGNDAFQLDITYGPDNQRWKAVLKKNNAVTKTTLYAGNYERITEGSVTREFFYLPSGAIYVKQTGQTDKIYYAHKDHLGSIVKLTDGNGTEVFAANYDAWGRQTITKNTFMFHRGFTGHEHLPEFGLINMNGRMYDPIVGRFLSADPFVQAPGFSQSFNRYSYCLNNPLKYIDPEGEWSWMVAGIGFVYGYVNYGLTKGDWGWKALGNGALTGVMWGIGYTSGVAEAGITPLSYAAQSAVSNTVNSFMPSMSMPISNNFSVNTSFGLGISPNGLVGGMNFSGTYHNDNFAFTGGLGASGNMASWGGGISYDDVGVNHYRTTFGNATGPDGKPNNQTVGGWGLNIKDFSLRIENDLFADKGDRWRTSAVEIGIKNFVIGTSVYTNAPDEKLKKDESYTSKFWNKLGFNSTKDAYADGRVFSSPLYVGVRQGGRVTRIGLNQPWIQDMTQNGVHLYLSKSSPLFYTPYGDYSSAYRYSGYYNPYSLYYR
jgi:RHS repeat-associated protein